MIIWELVLIVSVAGMVVLLARRLPVAVAKTKEEFASVAAVTVTPQLVAEPVVVTEPVKVEEKYVIDEPVLEEKNIAKVDAREAMQSAGDIIEEDLDPTEEEADAAYRAHDYKTAAAMYESLIRKNPEHPRWYSRLGLVYLELGKYHNARDAFRYALRFGEHVASRQAHLAMAEYALGHRLTAVRYLKRAIAIAPDVKQYQDLLETFESEA